MLIVLEVVLCLAVGSMAARADRFGLQRRADTDAFSNPRKVQAPLQVP
jgi:hypothetical protein